jgi:hypothetical protein
MDHPRAGFELSKRVQSMVCPQDACVTSNPLPRTTRRPGAPSRRALPSRVLALLAVAGMGVRRLC